MVGHQLLGEVGGFVEVHAVKRSQSEIAPDEMLTNDSKTIPNPPAHRATPPRPMRIPAKTLAPMPNSNAIRCMEIGGTPPNAHGTQAIPKTASIQPVRATAQSGNGLRGVIP